MMLWTVEQRRLWGDYGDILISGSGHRETETGPLLLHRTGPFLPPISFPWMRAGGHRIVVSDEFKQELEQAGFAGLAFEPAMKARIISLSWHTWDRTASEPRRYPPGGEPAEYIWEKPHSARAAAQMPDAWELLPPHVPLELERLEDPEGGYLDRFRALMYRNEYPSLFVSHLEFGELVVDQLARQWIQQHAGEWVTFCEIEIERAPPRGKGDRTNRRGH